MGGELVNGSLSHENEGDGVGNDTVPVSYKDIFWKCLPFYLAIGMTSDEFWRGDCKLAEVYREAYKIKTQQKNTELWLQGLYIYEAVGKLAPALNPMTKKGEKVGEYSKQPYPLSKEEAQKQKEEDEYKHQMEMRERILANSKSMRFKNKENENDNKE